MSKGSMREAMPTVAAFIDSMREQFGVDEINRAIRRGVAGEPGQFWARENGHELGTRFEDDDDDGDRAEQ